MVRRLLIDVTDTVAVSFTSGIQRVVKELTLRLLEQTNNIVLLSFDEKRKRYNILNPTSFRAKMLGQKSKLQISGTLSINAIGSSDCFLDMDSVWNSYFLRRQHLYPQLKSQGAKIGTLVHDVIPVTHPQYCHQDTVFHFLPYLAAVLQYDDFIIVTTQATKDQIHNLFISCSIEPVPIYVVPLGSNFQPVSKITSHNVGNDVKRFVQSGSYLMMMGTLEPRKNHRFLLDAWDEGLNKTPLNIVIAGRIGWNIEDFVERLKKHSDFDKRIFFVEGPSDSEVGYLYQNAYAVVFPTFEEGFGLPIIEAFHYGRPVFASDIPVCREVGGKYAEYFSLNSPKELVSLVKKYLDSPKNYEKMKQQIQCYHALSWDEVANMLIECLTTEL